jgi:hypothetical protein
MPSAGFFFKFFIVSIFTTHRFSAKCLYNGTLKFYWLLCCNTYMCNPVVYLPYFNRTSRLVVLIDVVVTVSSLGFRPSLSCCDSSYTTC